MAAITGEISSGVPSSVMPMNPIRSPPTLRITYGGKIGLPVRRLMTLAARNGNFAPLNGVPSAQPSTGWQPPFCRRRSSFAPSSNSWLPTAATSSPILFIASIAGSSWNSDDSSGLPPTVSPAATTSVCLRRRLSIRMCVGQVLGAAGEALRRAGASVRLMRPGVLGVQVAVEVVDAEQLHPQRLLGRLLLLLLGGRRPARTTISATTTSRKAIRCLTTA